MTPNETLPRIGYPYVWVNLDARWLDEAMLCEEYLDVPNEQQITLHGTPLWIPKSEIARLVWGR